MPPEGPLLVTVAIVLGLHGAIAAPALVCVCTSHVFTSIYQSGDSTTMPVGYMYEHDCKVHRPEGIYSIPGYHAIEHYHQVGYIKIDSGVTITGCPPNMDNSDRLTTPKIATPTPATHQSMTSQNAHLTSTKIHVTAAPMTPQQSSMKTQQPPIVTNTPQTHSIPGSMTSQQPNTMVTQQPKTFQTVTNLKPKTQTQTTILPAVTSHQNAATLIHHGLVSTTSQSLVSTTSQPRCNKVAIFSDIALGVNVGTNTNVACTDGKNHDSDGTITVFCSAPDMMKWRPDVTVADNCAHLPPYTPVAAFGPFGTYKHSAGVFLGCSAQGFHMATQSCSSKVHIEEVTLTSVVPADQFYVLRW